MISASGGITKKHWFSGKRILLSYSNFFVICDFGLNLVVGL